MTKLALLEKSAESTEGGCSWLLNLVNRARKSYEMQTLLMQSPVEYWTDHFPQSMDILIFQQKCPENKQYGKTKSKAESHSF